MHQSQLEVGRFHNPLLDQHDGLAADVALDHQVGAGDDEIVIMPRAPIINLDPGPAQVAVGPAAERTSDGGEVEQSLAGHHIDDAVAVERGEPAIELGGQFSADLLHHLRLI